MVSKITDGLFGKSAKPSQSSSGFGALPSDIQQGYRTDIIQGAQNIAGSPDAFAPISYSPEALQAINKQLSGLQQGVDYMRPDFQFGQKANAAFGKAKTYYNQAGQAYGDARNYLAGATPYIQQSADYTRMGTDPITGEQIQSSYNDFYNPYTNDVINNSLRDIKEYGQGLFSDARSLVSDAGGSGSNRANLLAGDIAMNQMRAVGDTSSQLRNQGYESAMSRAMNRLQTDKTNYLTGAGLSMNQATGMQNQAQGAMGIGAGYTNVGNSYANTGSNYLQGRQLMDNITQNNYNRATTGLQNQITAGDLLRQQQQQQQQIPLQQLALLQDVYNPLLNASNSVGDRAATGGLFGTGGNVLQGIAGIGKTISGFF